MKKYFTSVKTIDELKKLYRKLAMELHPDHGGNEAEFILMDDEYNDVLQRFQKTGSVKADDVEIASAFRDAVKAAMECDGVIIDLVGTWLWVSGNTFIHKDRLKAAGYRYSKHHKQWYFNGSEKTKHRASGLNRDEIDLIYGSTRVGVGKENEKILSA